MDGHQFDCLVQRVATRITRRRTLGILVTGATALLSGYGQEQVTARKRGQRVTTEGPCGDGSIKANRCKRNVQCCTGYCDKTKGKKPYGRCRCKNAGQSCQEDRNCCATAGQPMTCQDSICVSIAPPPACSSDEAACAPTLTNDSNGGCCLQDVACCNGDADCSDGQICTSGCCQDVCRTVDKNGVIAAC